MDRAPAETSMRDICVELARAARVASRRLASCSAKQRSDAIRAMAIGIEKNADRILEANASDVALAEEKGTASAKLDRLRLSRDRLASMATALNEIAALPDPIGSVIEGSVRPNGLNVSKIRVPLGVVLFIYESRPNVTTDAAGLCLKSGNALILRGGSEARKSNEALLNVIAAALESSGLCKDVVQMVPTTDRAEVDLLLGMPDCIDLAIPRGGSELIDHVSKHARMPVLKHDRGVCHIFLDRAADWQQSVEIVTNSKCQRPGVCNSAECLLIHLDVAKEFLPKLAAELAAKKVELRGCSRSRGLVPTMKAAGQDDFGREFLDLILAVRIVDSLEDAIEHINRFGSGHTESIVTADWSAARRFVAEVDASAVMVNASTRFNDGGELGLGAEIGISTGKFHARGPCGPNELTTTKYIVLGDGQVRS